MKRASLILVLLAVRALNGATAQTFSLNNAPLRVVSLDGLWRFHAGDDPDGKKGWAAPSFDDSSWALVRSDRSWPEQGLPVPGGSYWYRTTLLVPAGSGPLSLYMPAIHISYQVFADGKLVGTMGAMPPHPRPTQTIAAVFPVAAGSSQAQVVTLAIRAWRYPVWNLVFKSGLEPSMLVGDTRLIQRALMLNTRELFWHSASAIFLTLLESLAAIAALALFRVRKHEKEYLWFGIAMVASAVNDCVTTYRVFHTSTVHPFTLLHVIFGYAILFAFIGFYRHLMNAGRDWFYWCMMACISADIVINVVLSPPWALTSEWRLLFWVPATLLLQVPFYLWILKLLIRKIVQGRADALLLLLSNIPGLLGLYAAFIRYVAKPALGWKIGAMNWYFNSTQWPFPASVDNLGSFLLMLTMFGILVFRFTRTSLEEEEHKHELEAARIVQQVLIPNAIPAVHGFTIQSVYKPAGQVGGDFFQIIPISSGGVLVVIGDVSGKGMPAAMTVSLLVGTFRTLAHYTQSPAEILSAMNQRMLARSNGGFTTCLVVRIDAAGTLTVANAGHLPPYLNANELDVENGLPLGLSSESTYTESSFQLPPNARLTLLTDGVVEAQNQHGQLFGFDRTRQISTQPAESISAAAQAFGQQDDITVLTLTRQPGAERVAAELKVQSSTSLV